VYVDLRGLRLARLVAVAGDIVELSPIGITVTGRQLAPEELPGGSALLPGKAASFTVPAGNLVAVFPVPGRDGWGSVDLAGWQRLYQIPVAEVRGRATGIYLPIWRRRSFGGGLADER
jgi:hypothetical protein